VRRRAHRGIFNESASVYGIVPDADRMAIRPGSRVTPAARYALLIEDEALIAAIASDALQELGFEVIEASSAKAAMDCAHADIGRLAVAIVDLGLPDRKGDDLVSDLRALRSDLPIVIATGYGTDAVHRRLAGTQQIAVLTKPYDLALLRAALKTLNVV
jgi:DNA-binding response OmpR family regulator